MTDIRKHLDLATDPDVEVADEVLTPRRERYPPEEGRHSGRYRNETCSIARTVPTTSERFRSGE
jgi:hypothetical protein